MENAKEVTLKMYFVRTNKSNILNVKFILCEWKLTVESDMIRLKKLQDKANLESSKNI